MFNYLLYRLLYFLAMSLPLRLGYALAVFFSDVRSLFARRDRREVAENLKVIFPGIGAREISLIRRKMFRNFAKYLVDFFRFEIINKEYIRNNVILEGVENFELAKAQGKGVIVLTVHLGNWELGGVVMSLLGYPLWVVALEHKHKKVNELFNRQRESKGVKVVPLGRAARACLNALKENSLIGLVGDKDFSGNGTMKVKMFGRQASLPLGPAVFALKTGAAIVPGFMIRNPDDRFTLSIEKPLFFAQGDIKDEAAIRKAMEGYVAIFEEYIRNFPDQWYMFRRFWSQ